MILVVMAAGMGSRFGGMKQLTPVGPNQELLIDYSIYDAIKAGVKKVVFVIRKEYSDSFHEMIGKRIAKYVEVKYAYQELDDLPCKLPSMINRVKPWGTGQALLAARNYIDNSFMIINADDFYGRDAFLKLGEHLKKNKPKEYAMVAYRLGNTTTPNGTVSRGICDVSGGYLKNVVERTKIGYNEDKSLVYYEDNLEYEVEESSLVSMNLYGFTKDVIKDATNYFKEFLKTTKDLEHDEFYLPTIVQKSIDDGRAKVKVLDTDAIFYGMTYHEDLALLKENIKKLVTTGVYPNDLWRK